METLHTIPASSTQLSEPDSVTPEEIAAFLDGSLTVEDRARVEAHLADNPDARRELVDASRIIVTMPSTPIRRARFVPIAAIAAAAVIAIVLLKPGAAARSSATVPAERRGVAEQIRAVDMVEPVNGGEPGSTQSFIWRGIEGASYRLVILDAAGRTILQENTTDTVHSIPAIVLREAGRYYWNVDAQMPDGSSMTGGHREFVVKER